MAADEMDGEQGLQGEVRPPGLQRYTPARVGLRRSGSAIGTSAQLEFQLDHARARDAVYDQADFAGMVAALKERGLEAFELRSAVGGEAGARGVYLRRPDLGRRLSRESAEELRRFGRSPAEMVLIVADGLSGLAIDRHALPLLDALMRVLPEAEWRGGPVCLVRNGRVAVGDEIGEMLGARLTVLLIGERPGLSAPDSLGVYLTSAPRPGKSDAERNCVSNIRGGGLGYEEAARRIASLAEGSRRLGGTGFALKDGAAAGRAGGLAQAGSPKLRGLG